MLRIVNKRHTEPVMLDLLRAVGDALGLDVCWYWCGAFHFKIDARQTVSIRPESAGRVRIETWDGVHRHATTLWARNNDSTRAATVALTLRSQLATPAARPG